MALDSNKITEFLKNKSALEHYTPELKALWYDGNGDWKSAHDQVDHLPGKSAARIHAYLHRKEGDEWNAGYWYKKADANMSKYSLEEEWEKLLEEYLSKS